MAATGYTPISLYYSTTASAVPTSGNLANGELALNIADMKLYAKDSAGTVTLLASNSGATGTVSSVSGTGTVNGLTLTGTVTSSGSLTLGGTLSLVSPPPIGSTTPNTGAFTTLSATGTITSTKDGLIFNQSATSTAIQYGTFANTGNSMYWGLEGSAGGQLVGGSTAYDTAFRSSFNGFSFGTSSTLYSRISSTGLAVTGVITSTNYGTFRNLRIGTDGGNDIYSSASANIYYSTSGNSYGHVLGNASASSYAQFNYTAQIFYSSNVERARVQAGFSVGTTADPGAGAIYATGNITAYYSDDRLKTRLGNIENALDKVDQLQGFYYEANETAQALGYKVKREVGVSAQSVQAVLPEIVSPAPIDQQYLTVDYERLVPLLIEAVKELTAKVKALEAK